MFQSRSDYNDGMIGFYVLKLYFIKNKDKFKFFIIFN